MVDIRQERAFELQCDTTEIKKRLETWAAKSDFTRTLDSDTSWEFRRGTQLQASFTFDVRKIPTTVRVEASGDDSLWNTHSWPLGCALIGAALVSAYLSSIYDRIKPRVLVDPNTGEEVVLAEKHTLFFLRAKYWSAILAVAGLYFLISDQL